MSAHTAPTQIGFTFMAKSEHFQFPGPYTYSEYNKPTDLIGKCAC